VSERREGKLVGSFGLVELGLLGRLHAALPVHGQALVQPGGNEARQENVRWPTSTWVNSWASVLLPQSNWSVGMPMMTMLFPGKACPPTQVAAKRMAFCRSVDIGINIDIHGAVGAHADILRKPHQRLRSGIVQLLTKRAIAVIVMQVDVPAGDDLPGVNVVKPTRRSWWGC